MSVNEKKSIGISISDRSIEVLGFVKKEESFDVCNLGRKKFPSGIVESGRIIDFKFLKSVLLGVLKEASLVVTKEDNINFALPEAQIYTHVFKTGLNNKDEKKIVEEELLRVVPLKKKDLLFKYKKNKINNNVSIFEFLSLSIDRKVFLEWSDFFKSAGIKINNFYFEPLALFHGLFLDLPKEPLVLLDMGSRTSNLSIFINQELKYSYGIRIGGEYFTKKIAEKLKISLEKAEELKFNYGLRHPVNKLYNETFLKSLEHLKIEFKRNLKYFKANYLSEGDEINDLYLVGGSSKVLGIKDYFEHLDIFKNIKIGEPFVSLDGKTEFTEALGLAMSFFSHQEENFVFRLGEEKKSKNVKKNIKKSFSFSWPQKDFSRTKTPAVTGRAALEKRKLLLKSFLKYFLVFCLSFLFFFLVTTSFNNHNHNDKVPEINNSEPVLVVPEITEPKPEVKINKIKVRDTVSLLNIREGAGTNYAVVGKAKGGEEYILLAEDGDWQKIELPNKLWGWVHSAFTEKINK